MFHELGPTTPMASVSTGCSHVGHGSHAALGIDQILALEATGLCYGLNTECPPKVPCVKGYVPRVILLGGSGDVRRQDFVEGPEVIGSIPANGFSPLLHFCFPAMRRAVLLHICICHYVLPHHKPTATGPTNHGLEPLKL